MKQAFARVCNGLLCAPGVEPVPSGWRWEGGVLWVCLPCTNPALSPSASTPLSYCLARWLPRYLSPCSSGRLHAWPRCMHSWFAASGWVQWERQESSLSPCFLPAFPELGGCLGMLGSTLQCCAVLCGGPGGDLAPCMGLEDVWTRWHSRWTIWIF